MTLTPENRPNYLKKPWSTGCGSGPTIRRSGLLATLRDSQIP